MDKKFIKNKIFDDLLSKNLKVRIKNYKKKDF